MLRPSWRERWRLQEQPDSVGFRGPPDRAVDFHFGGDVDHVGEHVPGQDGDDLDDLGVGIASRPYRLQIGIGRTAVGLGDLAPECDGRAGFRVRRCAAAVQRDLGAVDRGELQAEIGGALLTRLDVQGTAQSATEARTGLQGSAPPVRKNPERLPIAFPLRSGEVGAAGAASTAGTAILGRPPANCGNHACRRLFIAKCARIDGPFR